MHDGRIIRCGVLLLTALITAYLIAPSAYAQTDGQTGDEEKRRWTVRLFYSFPGNWAVRNSRGLVDYLERNGFDYDTPPGNFFGGVDYPQVGTEDASRSFYAAYAIRPDFSVGGLYYDAQQIDVSGFLYEPEQEMSFDIDLQQTMRALAPIALWEPVGVLDIGAGPAFIWGGTAPYEVGAEQRLEAQETSFQRLGAVIFASVGFTVLDRYVYLGLQGQFLYGGTVEIGPYDVEEGFARSSPPETFTLSARKVRIGQLSWGPVIAVNF